MPNLPLRDSDGAVCDNTQLTNFGGYKSPQDCIKNAPKLSESDDLTDRQRNAMSIIASLFNMPSTDIAEFGFIHKASGTANRAALTQFIQNYFGIKCGDDLISRTISKMKIESTSPNLPNDLYRSSSDIICQLERDRMAWQINGPSEELQQETAVHALNLGRNAVALVKTRGFNQLPTPTTDLEALDSQLIDLAHEGDISGIDAEQLAPVQLIHALTRRWSTNPDQSIWTIGLEALKLTIRLSGFNSALGIIARLNLAYLSSDLHNSELESLVAFYESMEELVDELKPHHKEQLDQIKIAMPGEISFDLNGLRLALVTNAISRRIESTYRYCLMCTPHETKCHDHEIRKEFGDKYCEKMESLLNLNRQLAAIDKLLERAAPLRNANPFLYDANTFYTSALRYFSGLINRPTGDAAKAARLIAGQILKRERNDLLIRLAFDYAPKITDESKI